MKDLINQVKEENQDFEFYPTTKEMITAVYKDMIRNYGNINGKSVLDIGAGNGNVFDIIDSLIPTPKDEYDHKDYIMKYAIEKSKLLINNMERDIMIIGTDFHNNTLIDKKMDVIFSNPPYSEYTEWMLKILNEANCDYIYLVVPQRWKENKDINRALRSRFYKEDEEKDIYKVIWSGDFEDSEYRKARAKVDIIRINFKYNTTYGRASDPFDAWFDSNFKIKTKEEISIEEEKQTRKAKVNELVKAKNLIEALEELYRKDFNKLLDTYRKFEELDADILDEMDISVSKVKESLKVKISGLKDLYWKELFDNFDKITDRLTSRSRKRMLDKLTSHTSIDFTVSNAYALVIWVLKNANHYIDDQLLDMYQNMTEKDNVVNYKSNKVFLEDGWRYSWSKHTHYKLDYRLVFTRRSSCFMQEGSFSSYNYTNGLHNNAHEFLNDICTIGKNLGFDIQDTSFSFEWEAGQEKIFKYSGGEFMRIRAYKNGNIHCKPNQEFIKKFNIEAARLNGWVKDQTEAAKELELDIAEVAKYYDTNAKLLKSNIGLLN